MGIYEAANVKPLHLYLMVDLSSSMAGSKWDAAKAGLDIFLNDPEAAGIDVAVSFFPRPPDAIPACDQMAYKEPVVPFDLLPDNADPILAELEVRTPDAFNSPMYPALGGAILKCIDVVTANPDDVAAVLLVTDGRPEGPAPTCSGVDPEDPTNVAALAAAGLAFDPPIATFVIGLPGVDLTSANEIAAGGGTDEAIYVGTTDTATQFAEALAKVRGKALACRYDLPSGVLDGTVGLGYVNVALTPGGGMETVLPHNPDCDGPGWKFDDPANPTSIVLCDASCGLIEDDPIASIEIVLGCPTVQ
jgi:hypothetical protein